MVIPEQAGFRPGKACTGQVLNICQHIEDGFKNKKITGAYDTVNHNKLLQKVYHYTRDWQFVQIVASLLQNRHIYGGLKDKFCIMLHCVQLYVNNQMYILNYNIVGSEHLTTFYFSIYT